MKFKDLKKKEFVICFDVFKHEYTSYDVEISHRIINGQHVFRATEEYDIENGLYTETAYEAFPVNWKQIKYNLTHYVLRYQKKNKMPYYVYIYTGKCEKCGKPIPFLKRFNNYGFYNWFCDDCEKQLWDETYNEDCMIEMNDCIKECLEKTNA